MLDFSLITVFIVTFLLSLYLARVLGITRRKSRPPGPWGVPLLGHLPFLGKSIPKTFATWRKRYGDVFKIKFGSWDMIVINGYDAIKEAAEFGNDAFSSRADFVSIEVLRECDEYAHQMNIFPFNNAFLQLRKHVSSAFRVVLNPQTTPIYERISDEAHTLCATVLKKAEGNCAVSVDSDVLYSVSTVVYRLIYGDDIQRHEYEVNQRIHITNMIDQFASAGSPLDVMPWLRFIMSGPISTLRDLYMAFVNIDRRLIAELKETCQDESVSSLLDYIIRFEQHRGNTKEGQYMSKSLYNSLRGIFSAGNLSTAAALSWGIMYMIVYPEIQEKVQQEIDELTDNSRAVNLNDRPNLPYTMATLTEILRLPDILPLAVPHAATRDVCFRGYHIDKGTPVTFNLTSSNHDENIWDEPFKFRPERFLTSDDQLDQAKCRLLAHFGFGRRKCPGERLAKMNLFAFYATMMQRCSFSKPDGEVLDFTPDAGILYRPKQYKVLIKERTPMHTAE